MKDVYQTQCYVPSGLILLNLLVLTCTNGYADLFVQTSCSELKHAVHDVIFRIARNILLTLIHRDQLDNVPLEMHDTNISILKLQYIGRQGPANSPSPQDTRHKTLSFCQRKLIIFWDGSINVFSGRGKQEFQKNVYNRLLLITPSSTQRFFARICLKKSHLKSAREIALHFWISEKNSHAIPPIRSGAAGLARLFQDACPNEFRRETAPLARNTHSTIIKKMREVELSRRAWRLHSHIFAPTLLTLKDARRRGLCTCTLALTSASSPKMID